MFGWFKPKRKTIRETIPEIKVCVTMTDGRSITRVVSERDYRDAITDMARTKPNEDSLIFIGDVIDHVSNFKAIERV